MAFGDLAIARNIQELEMLDRSEQAVRTLNQIDKHLKAQAVATVVGDRQIVASLDAIHDIERRNGFALGEISAGLGLISDQLYDGFSQLAYEQRLQSDTLKSILQTLSSPSATQAREHRDRGIYAYRNGWYDDADVALKTAVEFDPFDFTVYQVLGDICLRHRNSPADAVIEFSKAAKYAGPVSPDDAAYAMLSQAKALRQSGSFGAARDAAMAAVALFPRMAEAHYAAAQGAAGAGDLAMAREELLEALKIKPELSLLAIDDGLLDGAPGFVSRALVEFGGMIAERARTRLAEIGPRLDAVVTASSTLSRLVVEQAAAYEAASVEKKSFWKGMSTPVPAPSPWTMSEDIQLTGLRAAEWLALAEHHLELGAILDSKVAMLVLADARDEFLPSAIKIIRHEYLNPALPKEGAAALLKALAGAGDDELKTAPCPKCGFKVSEWDTFCRACQAVWREFSLQVPDTLARAYNDFMTEERHYARFLGKFEACATSLPSGPNAREKLYSRFPKAMGRSGFEALVARQTNGS